jgi:ribose 5-phosphate isomerase RpiB
MLHAGNRNNIKLFINQKAHQVSDYGRVSKHNIVYPEYFHDYIISEMPDIPSSKYHVLICEVYLSIMRMSNPWPTRLCYAAHGHICKFHTLYLMCFK